MDIINPYAFDPIRCSSDDNDSDSDDSDSDDSCKTIFNDSNDNLELEQVKEEKLWCKCETCAVSAIKEERKCCHDDGAIRRKMDSKKVGCITNHPDFQPICLNIAVVEIAFLQYCEENGYKPDHSNIHRKYRRMAYRQFARWIFHRLGNKSNIVLPACVVKQIRQAFPREMDSGFKYTRYDCK